MATKPKAPTVAAEPAEAQAQAEGPVLEIELTRTRETKNTFRFEEPAPEDGARPAVGTIYLTKDATAALGNPETLRVTIEAI